MEVVAAGTAAADVDPSFFFASDRVCDSAADLLVEFSDDPTHLQLLHLRKVLRHHSQKVYQMLRNHVQKL